MKAAILAVALLAVPYAAHAATYYTYTTFPALNAVSRCDSVPFVPVDLTLAEAETRAAMGSVVHWRATAYGAEGLTIDGGNGFKSQGDGIFLFTNVDACVVSRNAAIRASQ